MYYALEGYTDADLSVNAVYRLVTGQGSSASGSYTAAVTAVLEDTAFSMSLTSTYVPATSLTGSVEVGFSGAKSTFTATALPTSQIDFSAGADLSHITGTWSGHSLSHMLDGPSGHSPLSINSTGQITSSGTGCSFTGVITPDASRNFFNVTLTFGSAPCANPNQTLTGVAVEMLLPNGNLRQLLIVTKDGKFAFAGQR
jgi:hypothetical protein